APMQRHRSRRLGSRQLLIAAPPRDSSRMSNFANASDVVFPRQAGLAVPARRLAFWILMAVLAYQAVLCAIHTNVHAISMAGVGLTEAFIYLACLVVLIRRIRLEFLAVATLVAAYLLLMAIFRNQLDPKG